MSVPGGFEEVIKYADFKKEATVEDVDDESTLEDEPDEEALEDIISGNITLNVSQIIVLPNGENFFLLYILFNIDPSSTQPSQRLMEYLKNMLNTSERT